jgi:ABC-type microcin C transport system duplicated ATPase subunit YejF
MSVTFAPDVSAGQAQLIQRLQKFRDCLRVDEVIIRHDLQLAKCCGHVVVVEEPEENGWKKWKKGPIGWYNNALEIPRDGMKTCWSEDEIMIEVERMARAWEKGSI